ncbi:MAG: Lrp/AsnC family transcriptional regulator [Candidatus Aenigmarchaeota archaeon]|nr:Lrp/AsnC family transcriptional regulator [Candidatus Aenigmarchaeota archaeon]
MLDKKNKIILEILQNNCKIPVKKISRKIKSPITTIYSRIKRLEDAGIIKSYSAILDQEKAGYPTTALVFVKMRYHYPEETKPISQRDVAKKISFLPGVTEVFIVAGQWDIVAKVKGRNIKEMGEFVIDKLREIKGVDNTLTSHVWVTVKESQKLDLNY